MDILCADKLADEVFEPLRRAGHRIDLRPEVSADEFPAALSEGRYEVLVVRSTQVTAQALEASSSLSMVVRAGAGTDNIDKATASALGVYVCNVPGRNAIVVAELAMGLMLAIDRHIPDGTADLRAGRWDKTRHGAAAGIHGRRLALIGLGQVGLAVAERARAFGMSVLALDKPDRSDDALARIDANRITLVPDLSTLLAAADVVSLHVPRSPETVGMVDAGFLEAMNEGAVLINTARGDLVQTDALLEAMDRRGIRAGLDVWPDEPGTGAGAWDSPLAKHPNVVGTHHIGASTQQAQDAIASGTVKVIKKYAKGRVVNCVNLVEEPLGNCMLTVRHHDRVGVLARVFDCLRSSGINVQQMQNQVFSGGTAAVASMHLDDEPPAAFLDLLGQDPDILGVSLSRNGAK